MAGEALILARSWADNQGIDTSSEVGDFLAVNLLDPDMGEVLRTADTAALTLSGDFGQARACGVFTLWAHNLGPSSRVRLELAADEGFSQVLHDVTYYGKAPAYGFGEWPLDVGPWGGFTDGVDVYQPDHCTQVFPAVVVARYWRLTVTDPDNPDGYLQATRWMIGDPLQSGVNIELGLDIGWVNAAQIIEQQDGTTSTVGGRHSWRQGSMAWRHLTSTEARALNELSRATGHQNTVLVIPYPEGRTRQQRAQTVLARLIELPVPRIRQGPRWEARVSVVEATA